jgi:hypothetical protein
MFFGLNLRQFICSILACAAGVGLYFYLKPRVSTEIVSWACILGALPFSILGFLRYNGMSAEEFISARVKSGLLAQKKLVFLPENLWFLLLSPVTERHIKENMKEHGKDSEKRRKKR